MKRLEMLTAKALKRLGNDRYRLAMAVSQRANELSNGAKALVVVSDKNIKYTEVAIEEIAEGRVTIEAIIDKDG